MFARIKRIDQKSITNEKFIFSQFTIFFRRLKKKSNENDILSENFARRHRSIDSSIFLKKQRFDNAMKSQKFSNYFDKNIRE